jgi:hypothetical protein
MWERTANVAATSWWYTPAQADSYCADNTLAGHSDWRLPSVTELISIVDFTVSSPAIDSAAFPGTLGTVAHLFWTSTPHARSAGYRWYVSFDDGTIWNDRPVHAWPARCVRTATPSHCYRPGSRYEVADNLVTDAATGLVWQQNEAGAAGRTWTQAQNYCATIPGGFRLPSLNELVTIADYTVSSTQPLVNATAFPNAFNAEYWTSSLAAGQSGMAWVVDFTLGGSREVAFSSLNMVRCVR